MTISTTVPESWRLPLFWAVVDGSMAGNLIEAHRVLLVGQMFTAGGNAGQQPQNVPTPVGSLALAAQYFGQGSMVYRMVEAFLATNTNQQLWAVGVPEPSAGVAATTSLLVNVTVGSSGVINLYIAGQLVSVAVGTTDTSTTIAAALVAAINSNKELPVTAVAGGSNTARITLTCQWKGLTGNDISVVANYLGLAGGQTMPVGVSITLEDLTGVSSSTVTTSSPTITYPGTATTPLPQPGMTVFDITNSSNIGTVLNASYATNVITVTLAANSLHAIAISDILLFSTTASSANQNAFGWLQGGAGVPNFAAAISAIQPVEFDYVALPFTDSGSLSAWNAEYGFGATGRWSYSRQQYGMIFSAARDTYANLLTWGLTQNSPVISVLAVETGVYGVGPPSPSPVWEWAASYCAVGALGFSDDPARPLQTLEMPFCLEAPVQVRFTPAQLNSLAASGLAVQATDPSGNPMVMIEQTQYQFNAFGQADTAFGLLTILATLQELLRRMKSAITTKYPRVKLVPDGTRLSPGQAAVQPSDVKAELVAEFIAAEFDGLVADLPDFKANLLVQIDSQNPNRLNVLWPPQLAGQLRQFVALAQFRLLYPQTVQ